MQTYDPAAYERPSVTVDLLIFTIHDGRLQVLTVRRAQPPFAGFWALPGSFVGIDEALEDTVRRCLQEKIGLQDIFFEQLYTWGAVQRDPRMRVLSVSYMALVPWERLAPQAGARVEALQWFSAETLPQMAFDHAAMVACGVERLRGKTEYTTLAFQLMPVYFTLPELQQVYEILLGRPLYKANFRKKIQPFVQATNEMARGGNHRPSRLYTFCDPYEKSRHPDG